MTHVYNDRSDIDRAASAIEPMLGGWQRTVAPGVVRSMLVELARRQPLPRSAPACRPPRRGTLGLVIVLIVLIAGCLPGASTGSSPAAPGAVWSVETLPSSGALADIVATDSRLVAVGYEHWESPTIGAVWTSVDGATWTPVPAEAGLDGGRATAVAAGPGRVVAVGRACAEGDCDGTSVWASVDGLAWARGGDILPTGPPDLTSAAWFAGGFVIGGSDGGDAVILHSPDGRDWTTALRIEMAAGDGASMAARSVWAIAPFDGGLAAAGDGAADGAQVWSSTDGREWRPAGVVQGAFVRTLVDHGGRLFAGGRTGGGGVPEGRIWVSDDGRAWDEVVDIGDGEVLDLAVVEGVIIATAMRSSGAAVLLTSDDGTAWEPADLPRIEPWTLAFAVTSFGGRAFGVGGAGAVADEARMTVWRDLPPS